MDYFYQKPPTLGQNCEFWPQFFLKTICNDVDGKLIKIKDNQCEIKTKEKTLQLMKKYKWQNVRGSIWNKINIEMPIELKKN